MSRFQEREIIGKRRKRLVKLDSNFNEIIGSEEYYHIEDVSEV